MHDAPSGPRPRLNVKWRYDHEPPPDDTGGWNSVFASHAAPQSGVALRRGGAPVKFAAGVNPGNDAVRADAADYARRFGPIFGFSPIIAPHARRKVDEALSHRTADAFQAAAHAPQDPEVKAAYRQLIHEIVAQYEHALENGKITFEPWVQQGQPYQNSAEMRADVQNNRHLWFFPTVSPHQENSFGATGGDLDPEVNPLVERTGHTLNGYKMTVNDMLRAVHDYYGHAKEGLEFGPEGEYNAWAEHAKMFSPEALKALTTETHGQNSWVNFGPHLRRPDGSLPKKGDTDYVHPKDRPYAEQKVFILPPDAFPPAPDRDEPVRMRRAAAKPIPHDPGTGVARAWVLRDNPGPDRILARFQRLGDRFKFAEPEPRKGGLRMLNFQGGLVDKAKATGGLEDQHVGDITDSRAMRPAPRAAATQAGAPGKFAGTPDERGNGDGIVHRLTDASGGLHPNSGAAMAERLTIAKVLRGLGVPVDHPQYGREAARRWIEAAANVMRERKGGMDADRYERAVADPARMNLDEVEDAARGLMAVVPRYHPWLNIYHLMAHKERQGQQPAAPEPVDLAHESTRPLDEPPPFQMPTIKPALDDRTLKPALLPGELARKPGAGGRRSLIEEEMDKGSSREGVIDRLMRTFLLTRRQASDAYRRAAAARAVQKFMRAWGSVKFAAPTMLPSMLVPVSVQRVKAGQPVDDTLHAGYDGSTLSIHTGPKDGDGVGRIKDEYAVNPQDDSDAAKVYSLAGKGEPYTVTVGKAGADADSCTCKGYANRKYCKHVAALRGLTDAGRLSAGDVFADYRPGQQGGMPTAEPGPDVFDQYQPGQQDTPPPPRGETVDLFDQYQPKTPIKPFAGSLDTPFGQKRPGESDAPPAADQPAPAGTPQRQAQQQIKADDIRKGVDELIAGTRFAYHLKKIGLKYQGDKRITGLVARALKGEWLAERGQDPFTQLGHALAGKGDRELYSAYRWEHAAAGLKLDRAVESYVRKKLKPGQQDAFRKLAGILQRGDAGKSSAQWQGFWDGLREAVGGLGLRGRVTDDMIRRSLNRASFREEDRAEIAEQGRWWHRGFEPLPHWYGRRTATHNPERFRRPVQFAEPVIRPPEDPNRGLHVHGDGSWSLENRHKPAPKLVTPEMIDRARQQSAQQQPPAAAAPAQPSFGAQAWGAAKHLGSAVFGTFRDEAKAWVGRFRGLFPARKARATAESAVDQYLGGRGKPAPPAPAPTADWANQQLGLGSPQAPPAAPRVPPTGTPPATFPAAAAPAQAPPAPAHVPKPNPRLLAQYQSQLAGHLSTAKANLRNAGVDLKGMTYKDVYNHPLNADVKERARTTWYAMRGHMNLGKFDPANATRMPGTGLKFRQDGGPLKFGKNYQDLLRAAASAHFGNPAFQEKLLKLHPQQQSLHEASLRQFLDSDLVGILKRAAKGDEDVAHEAASRILFGHDGSSPFFEGYKPQDANLIHRFVAFAKGYAGTAHQRPARAVPIHDVVPEKFKRDPDKPRRFSSTQINLPEDLAKKVQALTDQIPDSDLAEKGVELESHVTVCFGLH